MRNQGPVPFRNSPGQEKEKRRVQAKSYFLNVQWIGSNPNTVILAQEKVTNYFTYSDRRDATGKSTIKATAFKKIIYKNIYPGIDVEYTFPENKGGIKYNIILHPGADPSVIKMQYEGAKKISTDAEGNIIITSSFGDFVDHVPVTYYEGGTNIESAFQLNDNIVSFKLNQESRTKNQELTTNRKQTIIIDPWTTTPTFTGTSKAYDVDWDYLGNIYIYGGQHPFELSKLNSAGVIQWTYSSTLFDSAENDYGDFTLDRNTGTS